MATQCNTGSTFMQHCVPNHKFGLPSFINHWLEDSRQSNTCLVIHYLHHEHKPPFPFHSWQERHAVCSSAAVAHLLRGSTCCAFRDGILHTLVVTSGYLSYCCLSIISNQSAHPPLTSTRYFRPHNCRYFLFFGPFSVNPRDGCAWISQ